MKNRSYPFRYILLSLILATLLLSFFACKEPTEEEPTDAYIVKDGASDYVIVISSSDANSGKYA